MRRKGALGGAVDTGLNALPVVGTLKAGLEWWRGRDLIPDRATTIRARSGPRRSSAPAPRR
jgi:hypothetical protein